MATLPQPALQLPAHRDPPRENVSAGFIVALALHAGLIGAGLAWALITHTSRTSWGERSAQSGSIQASMVSALPLPPKQLYKENSVLTSEKPNIAPPPPTPKAEPPPKPHEILIPEKVIPKPVKIAEKAAPEPPKHPQPVAPTPTKATTGETAGVRIAMATQQVKNGTASITVDDRSFGDRYAYYTRIVDQKVSEAWNASPDAPGATPGMKAVVVFTINPDGTPSDARILIKSGSPALDTVAVRAIQRIEGFGTLPQPKAITVEFALDYKQP